MIFIKYSQLLFSLFESEGLHLKYLSITVNILAGSTDFSTD